MFTWQHSETVPTQASARQVWTTWKDAETWPAWDSELEWVRLDGEFAEGTTGRMKPASGPKVGFVLTEVTPDRSFTDTARLPLTDMVFKHEYLAATGQEPARIRHTVTMKGALAPLFGRVIGRQIRSHLRGAMVTLSDRAMSDDRDATHPTGAATTVPA